MEVHNDTASDYDSEETNSSTVMKSSSSADHYHFYHFKYFMSADTLELIISFLESKFRMVMELVCLDLRQACLSVERRELMQLFDQLNDEQLIVKPLHENPITIEEEIAFEKRIPGFKIRNFYMREFLKRSNGRMDWHDSLFHPVNIIAPIEEWTKDFGYLYYKDKEPILNLLEIDDFNLVSECLVCIGSTSQKLCWGTGGGDSSSDSGILEYNPFHVRTRKLYADKNFTLYDLEYKGFEDFTLKKLGNLKQWFNSLLLQLPQQQQQQKKLKIVPKREPIRYASKDKQSDPEFIRKYLKNNGSQLKYVSKEMRNNKQIVQLAVSNYLDSVQYASYELKDDETFMREIVRMHPLTVRFCSERVKRTSEILEPIQSKKIKTEELESLSPLEFIPSCHYDNKEFVLNMIQKTSCNVYLSLPDSLKEDRDVCLEAVRNGLPLSNIPTVYSNDREIVVTAIQLSAYQYEHASERLRSDREIVLLAFKKTSRKLLNVPFQVSDNKELMMEAMSSFETVKIVFDVLSERLKADEEVAIKCVNYRWDIYELLPLSLRRKTNVLTHALQTNHKAYYSGIALRAIPQQTLSEFCNDYSKALLLVTAIPLSFKHVSVALRSNKKFVLEVLSSHVSNTYSKFGIEHIGRSLLCDEEIIIRIANKGLGEELMSLLPTNFKLSDDAKHHLIMTNPLVLQSFEQTPELIKLALAHSKNVSSPSILSIINPDLLTLELIICALKIELHRYDEIPERFKTKENILEMLKELPLLFGQREFGLSNRRDMDYIKIGIREAANFKEIPPTCLTTELVIEALQNNTASKVKKLIYPHLPVHFYHENEQINKLLMEKVPNFMTNLQ